MKHNACNEIYSNNSQSLTVQDYPFKNQTVDQIFSKDLNQCNCEMLTYVQERSQLYHLLTCLLMPQFLMIASIDLFWINSQVFLSIFKSHLTCNRFSIEASNNLFTLILRFHSTKSNSPAECVVFSEDTSGNDSTKWTEPLFQFTLRDVLWKISNVQVSRVLFLLL